MGKLDIQFLWGIESEKYGTSLGGSCQLYSYNVGGEITKVLLDIGWFVGMDPAKAPKQRENINPEEIDIVLMTHVHNDHSWRIAELVKAWYAGPIYLTPFSADLLVPILNDSLKIQRGQIQTAKDSNKRLWTRLQLALSTVNTKVKRDNVRPATIEQYQSLLDKYNIKKNSDIRSALVDVSTQINFDEHDILQTISQIRPIEYGKEFDLCKWLWSAKFLDAWHVVWSAQVLMDFKWNRKNSHKFPFKLLNTGDLWRFSHNNLLKPPTITKERVDATVIEGTYGGRRHAKRQPEVNELIDAIKEAKGTFVMPAFSLQRFQEVMYILWQSLQNGLLTLKKEEKIYCTSPLAYEFCMILMKHDPEKYGYLADPVFYRIQTREDEQMISAIKKQRKIVIPGWWMGQGWSSVKYIQQALQSSDAHIRFTGYQAAGTLGRELLDKYGTTQGVDIWDKVSPIRATVKQLKSFSSHADESELVNYMKKLDIRSAHKTMITHGGQQRYDLKNAMQDAWLKTIYYVPELFDTISIETVKNLKVNKRYT